MAKTIAQRAEERTTKFLQLYPETDIFFLMLFDHMRNNFAQDVPRSSITGDFFDGCKQAWDKSEHRANLAKE